jgi:aerobic-type carbon monoxide dehydrogenase small subunit (CoxS/CutS family)
MTTVAALERNPQRSDSEIRDMLAGLKCRCGTHMAIMRAVRKAADAMALGRPVAGTRTRDYEDREVRHG